MHCGFSTIQNKTFENWKNWIVKVESCALIIVQANNFVFKWPFNWCQMKSNNELHCVRILAAFLNFISCPWYYPWCSAVVGKALSPSITWHWRHWRPLLCSVSHVALGIVGSQEGHHLLTTFTGIISWLWRHIDIICFVIIVWIYPYPYLWFIHW